MILKVQQNELFQIAQSVGIEMSQLGIGTLHDGAVAVYLKTNPNIIFRVRQYKTGDYEIMVTPFVVKQIGVNDYSENTYSWKEVINFYMQWIAIAREEINAPDLWSDFIKGIETFSTTNTASDEKFSNNEIRELQAQIRTLSSHITQSTLPASAKTALLSIANSAPEKAERFTKKEWQGWFLGAVVTQITTLTLSPEHVSAVYQMLKTTFSALLLH